MFDKSLTFFFAKSVQKLGSCLRLVLGNYLKLVFPFWFQFFLSKASELVLFESYSKYAIHFRIVGFYFSSE